MNDITMSKLEIIQPDWSRIKVAVVVSRWNSFITGEMAESAVSTLKSKGITSANIVEAHCPGSFELPLACRWFMQQKEIDGVIAIGVVIRGGTPHFEYVCDAVTRGITDLNTQFGKPAAFGVLTTDNVEQALERSSVDKGNKGAEAAHALCDMLVLKTSIKI